MRFKVPQDVQREDLILGPLTIKQLIIAIIGGGIAWLLWKSIEAPLSYPFVLAILAITAAVVLIKIQGLTFTKYMISLFLLLLKPRSRSWQKNSGELWLTDKDSNDLARIKAERAKKDDGKKNVDKSAAISKYDSLEGLAEILDRRGEIKEKITNDQ